MAFVKKMHLIGEYQTKSTLMYNYEYLRPDGLRCGSHMPMSMKKFFYIAASCAFLGLLAASHSGVAAQDLMRSGESYSRGFPVPSSIEAEHKELHETLAKIKNSGGKTAAAAKEVEKLLRSHFVKEEQFALPPLGLLPDLVADKVPPNSAGIIKLTDRLKTEMPDMLAEHKKIVGALQRLREAAQAEKKNEAVQFAERLNAHATQEEQILYPSAILVGEYLKLKHK